jgi:hypothetical protein
VLAELHLAPELDQGHVVAEIRRVVLRVHLHDDMNKKNALNCLKSTLYVRLVEKLWEI